MTTYLLQVSNMIFVVKLRSVYMSIISYRIKLMVSTFSLHHTKDIDGKIISEYILGK